MKTIPRASLLSAAVVACSFVALARDCPSASAEPPFRLTSASFAAGKDIPQRHTCEGADVSPPLAWNGAPQGTKSFALVIDDPDAPDPNAPKTTFVHWVLYDVPANVTTLPEAVTPASLPKGAREGKNDFKQVGYKGPCPPVGEHRYFHKVYALDVVLPDLQQPDKAKLEDAMRGHVLNQAILIGKYQKRGNKPASTY